MNRCAHPRNCGGVRKWHPTPPRTMPARGTGRLVFRNELIAVGEWVKSTIKTTEQILYRRIPRIWLGNAKEFYTYRRLRGCYNKDIVIRNQGGSAMSGRKGLQSKNEVSRRAEDGTRHMRQSQLNARPPSSGDLRQRRAEQAVTSVGPLATRG